MKRLLLALALVLLVTEAHAQTPTPVTAGTPTADSAQRTDQQTKRLGGAIVERAETFAGGLQVGTPTGGAALLTFVARGTCLVDPSASLTTGAETIVSCTATGAAANDLVLGSIATTSDVTDVFIKRATAYTDSVQFSIGSYGTTQNPGDLEIRYLVAR